MKEVGETQNSLSEKLDMTQGGLQHWLAGTRQPALEDLNRIAKELQCSGAWLTHGLDEQDSADGLPEPGRSTLRRLIGAQRSGQLPASIWAVVDALLNTVATPPTGALDQAVHTGEDETPTSHTAPRNGTHG